MKQWKVQDEIKKRERRRKDRKKESRLSHDNESQSVMAFGLLCSFDDDGNFDRVHHDLNPWFNKYYFSLWYIIILGKS